MRPADADAWQTGGGLVKGLRASANVTNLFDKKGVSTAGVTSNSGGYTAFAQPPRMAFLTLSADF